MRKACQLNAQTHNKCRFPSSFDPPRIPLKKGDETEDSCPTPYSPDAKQAPGRSNPNHQTADRYYVCLMCLLTRRRVMACPYCIQARAMKLGSRFHFHCFHEAITLRNRVYASGTIGENMMPNARVRGLKTRNISQKYLNIDRLFSPLLPVAQKLAQIPTRGRCRRQHRPRAACRSL